MKEMKDKKDNQISLVDIYKRQEGIPDDASEGSGEGTNKI